MFVLTVALSGIYNILKGGCVFLYLPVYIVDQDNSQWFHHSRLSGQVDVDDKVSVSHAVSINRTTCGKGGAHGARRCLLRQHHCSPLPQVWQERGQETRGGCGVYHAI